MAIITRFGGSGGGTPVVDPYPHVWECTVVQSGTTGVVSGVVTLEAYDILHYTMPLGFSTYDLMIGGVTYHTSFRNEGEMYIQWTGNDFVVVSANAACALPHVWVNPTYTITGSVLEITAGVDDLHTNDVIELTLASGESASVIEYDSNTYLIDTTIDDSQTNYVMFNGTSFELLNPKFNFLGDATINDVLSGKKFYSNSDTLLTGNYVPPNANPAILEDIVSVQTIAPYSSGSSAYEYHIPNMQSDKALVRWVINGNYNPSNVTRTQSGTTTIIRYTGSNLNMGDLYVYELDKLSVTSDWLNSSFYGNERVKLLKWLGTDTFKLYYFNAHQGYATCPVSDIFTSFNVNNNAVDEQSGVIRHSSATGTFTVHRQTLEIV